MPIFKYDGRDRNGSFISGERSAESPEKLSVILFNEGVTPIHINQQESNTSFLQQLKSFFQTKKVSNADLALFTRQMYTLSKAGVAVSTAMRNLSKTSRSSYLAQILLEISQKLESGQSLSSAMEQYPDIFPPLIIAMVRIGQNTGQLDNAFLRLSQYLELEESTIKRVKTSLRYPIFVTCSIVIGIIIINIFVIPAFAKVYMRANIALPAITVMLINISNFFAAYWVYFLAIVIILIISIYRYLKSERGAYKWSKFQLSIPVVGYLLRRIILLRFAETFTIVVESGVPINEGLTLVAQSINSKYAREEIMIMKNAIQRGSSIFQAASACKLFTTLELQMLAISEETGELGEMLREVALYYQREVDYDLQHLIDVIEPVLLFGIAIMVLFLALAVYMPIWNMVKLVHHQ